MTTADSAPFSIAVASPGMPAWYPSVNTIVAIPSNTLEATPGVLPNPPPVNEHGSSWPESIMSKWSGGALIYLGGQPYLLVWGCGHKGGSDNSLYKFGPLAGSGADTPVWSRHWGPTPNADIVDCVPYYRDGNPAARHTYEHLVFRNNKLYSMNCVGIYCQTGAGENTLDYFDFATGQWVTDFTARPFNEKGAGSIHQGNGKYYYKSSGMSLWSYDFPSDTWTNLNYTGSTVTYDFASAIDPTRDLMIVGSGANSMSTVVVDLRTGVGEDGVDGGPDPGHKVGYAYEPDLDRIVAHGDNSRTVYFWSPQTRSWASEVFAGDTPDGVQGNGTYGRWQYVPELKGCVLVNSTQSSVYFFRTS